jgi:GDP-4-dehydro-6-deoxy-D-mannose reductase
VGGPTLVTGGTGFAGSHLIERLLADGHLVAAWSNPRGASARQPDPRVQWRAVDLLDADRVSDAIGSLSPSAIFHLGGLADVGQAWNDPARALRINALGTHHVLEAVSRRGLDCPVLVTSSALVYRTSGDALTESSTLGPSSPYGLSKLAQEMVALQETRARVFVARPFNHAGPRQSPAYVTSGFARQIAEIEAGRREPVIRVGNLESRRDITDVRDTVTAYRRIVEHGQPLRPYNVCCGRTYRVADLLDLLLSMSRTRVSVQRDPARMRPADTPVVLGSLSRIRDETGWQPVLSIERTLADLLDYWRQQTAAALQ